MTTRSFFSGSISLRRINPNLRLLALSALLVTSVFPALASVIIFPAEAQTLNYTQVNFRWPALTGKMTLEISSDTSFRKGVISVPGLDAPAVLVRQGLQLGQEYAWRVIAFRDGFPVDTSEVHHFAIGKPRRIDSLYYRNNVVHDAFPAKSQLLIAEDKPGVFINLEGEVVWFHPDTNIRRLFDLRQLPDGKIAYLRPKGTSEGNDDLVFEIIDRDGHLLWKAPDTGEISGDTSEFYHHAWHIRPNGQVIICGNRYETRPVMYQGKQVDLYCKLGTLIEYNRKGEVVWHWNASDYLSDEELTAAGLSDNPAHLNGFHFDENSDRIIISLRYLNLLIEIDHATGDVIHRWKGAPSVVNEVNEVPPFARQHSPVRVGDKVWMFDNGWGMGADSVSALVAIQGDGYTDSVELEARYPLFFQNRRNSFAESKGDIDYLGDGRWLIGMGALPRTVIYDTRKSVLWQCEHFMREDTLSGWEPLSDNYRADWAFDLYPIHFEASLQKTGTGFTLRVVNKGRYADQYRWEWPTKDKEQLFWQIPSLDPGEETEIQLPSLFFRKKDSRQLIIRSLHAPGETWEIDLSGYE